MASIFCYFCRTYPYYTSSEILIVVSIYCEIPITPVGERISKYSMPKIFMGHTAGRTGSSVASLERLLVATLAKIVGAGVDDDGALLGC